MANKEFQTNKLPTHLPLLVLGIPVNAAAHLGHKFPDSLNIL